MTYLRSQTYENEINDAADDFTKLCKQMYGAHVLTWQHASDTMFSMYSFAQTFAQSFALLGGRETVTLYLFVLKALASSLCRSTGKTCIEDSGTPLGDASSSAIMARRRSISRLLLMAVVLWDFEALCEDPSKE